MIDVTADEFMTIVQTYETVVIGPINGCLYALVRGAGAESRYRLVLP